MKKTLATLLVLAMVASLCCLMFVSAEVPNLALGKTVTGADPKSGSNYTAALTDGQAAAELSYDNNWFAYYWNPDKTAAENQAAGANSVDGVGTPVVDLGEICTLETVRINTFLGCKDGITPPDYITVEVSTDGESYTEIENIDLPEAPSGDTTVDWVEIEMDGAVARYVRLKFGHVSTWVFINEIEVYGTAGAGETEPAPEPEMFWLTHYNDGFVEGSGVIFTETDSAGGWWLHVAFAPIAGVENAYEIVEITNGLADGSAAKVAVPEDGFVWAANYGNNYPAIYPDDTTAIDYTSPNCSDAIVRATAWAVGDQFVFGGVDFETIPTTTPDVNWYEDAYVCTATITEYVPGAGPVVVTETIELDGKLDDTGYTNAVWFADGLWQYAKDTDPIISDLDVQYTVRSDDANIYLTIKVNRGVEFDAPLPEEAYSDTTKFNQVGSTNFRIWLCGDGMESRTFYDLLWDGEKFETFRAKVLTEEVTYEAGIGDDYINLEMAIAKESLAITDSFQLMVTYSTPYCGEGDNVGYNAFHMTACDEMPEKWSSNTAAYSEYVCADIALGTYTVENEGGNDEDDKDAAREELIAELEALVGEAIDDPAYTWHLEVALDEETGNVIVTATLSGVDAAQLQCIEGTLHYDADVLTLLTTADKENALLCLTEPAGSEGEWENMSTLVEDGEIRLGATTFGSATLSDEDPMIFTLEFALAEGTTLTGLYIDTPETYGMNVDADVVNGNGAYGILEIVEEEEPTPSTPSEDESKPSTGAGDAGILVFAILGILAVAGAAVVIKVRN